MAVLVANDTHFALGRGDSRALSLADDLSVRVRKAVGSGDVTALNRLFDMEFSFGRREEQGGVITHSTDPSRPGTLAFEGRLEFNGTASLLTRTFDGREQASTWFAVWP